MKILIIGFILCTISVSAQTGYPADLFINIKNDKSQPQQNVELKLKELKGTTYYALTNLNGGAKFKAKRGKKYVLDINNQKDFAEINIPVEGTKPVVENFTYNVTDKIAFDTTVFEMQRFRLPTDNEVILKVLVASNKMKLMPGKEVRLVCNKLKKVFVSKSESGGAATFIVYPGQAYKIGVEEQDSLGIISLVDKGGIMTDAKVFYQPTDIIEKNINDTILQQLKESQEPTTSHVYVSIKLWDMNMRVLPNENIYMDMEGSKTVYKATTNASGVAGFLLPKGKKFALNLKYERNLDIIEYPQGPNLHRINIEFNYMGSEKIENFYKTTTRDKDGFLTEFMSPKIHPCSFDPKWIEKTKNGFNVNFPSNSSNSPPTANGNKLYLNAGYYSPELYCIDKNTGDANWGARLAENGISASICVDDIILANTESCTLYAIDAIAGNLLWSKWLGPNIYSTPTVSDGTVFAVYPNNLDSRYLLINRNLSKKNHFVLAAFDLKTGNIKWQAWVDEEVIASPVACNNRVYMTSMTGNLYQFDMQSGKQLNMLSIKAVTPPTIVDNNLFVCIENEKNYKTQELAIINTNDMKITTKVKNISGNNFFTQNGLNAIDRMNYSSGRVTHLKGKNFNILGGKLFCFDASGKILWQTTLTTDAKQADLLKCTTPIIAGEKILVNNGKKIQIYNPNTGKLIKEFSIDTELYADAIAYNGWIYTGTRNGKVISIDTKDPTINNWPTWNGNAAHNPVIR